ncbi:hypothetical protein QVD17_17741 [Tagetes erecta]|uniref:BHLH domain-containing protein n=1 Tax=Tagetes erecta TaxID=13708 RepID=A0AAD8KXG8_TARER|nr:hypothetical protein QVD17_17741 [Tagetes erecta]
MLALSPPLLYTGWSLENLTCRDLQPDCNDIYTEFEANSYNPLLDCNTYPDFPLENSISGSSEVARNDNSVARMKVAKKLNHNASERDRRKKVNGLYTFLRSLLPMSNDQKRKVSIPQTISRALKYIPELQKEIEGLIHKKEKLSSYNSSSSGNTRQDHLVIKKQSAKDATFKRNKSPVVCSVRVLGEKEAVIQLVFSEIIRQNKDVGFLSKVLEYLERDEDGVVLLNSTTIMGLGDVMLLNTLHVQAQGDKKIYVERLREKLDLLFQN